MSHFIKLAFLVDREHSKLQVVETFSIIILQNGEYKLILCHLLAQETCLH